jgi:hypothetical protein
MLLELYNNHHRCQLSVHFNLTREKVNSVRNVNLGKAGITMVVVVVVVETNANRHKSSFSKEVARVIYY